MRESVSSNKSESWKNRSPFSESNRFELSCFSEAQIEALLNQYQKQYQRNHGVGKLSEIPLLASIIYQRTLGFPGLTGMHITKPLMESCSDCLLLYSFKITFAAYHERMDVAKPYQMPSASKCPYSTSSQQLWITFVLMVDGKPSQDGTWKDALPWWITRRL